MKQISLLIITTLISCSPTEVEFEYPDCIDRPSEIISSFGCGNVFLYQFLDNRKAVVVTIDATNIKLSKECQSISLENGNDHISVTLETAGTSLDSIYFNYCNDVVYINQGKLKIYKGTKGVVSFSVSEDNPIKDPIWQSNYRITVEIHDLYFYDNSGILKMVIDKIVFWDVGVGWMPG